MTAVTQTDPTARAHVDRQDRAEGSRRGAITPRVAALRARLLEAAPSDRVVGWLGPLVAAVFGGVLRFWHLGDIRTLIFDETYYVKEGYSMMLYGVEMHNNETVNKDNALWNTGVFDPARIFTSEGDFVVHPPVGKWLIGLGEQLFGIDNPMGWRFAVALLGTLSILMLGRAARRLFQSTYLGTCAAFLLAMDGMHLVMSRTGILDLIVMFWALAGFCALLIDRDQARAKLARRAEDPERLHGFGPMVGLRPWRLIAGICLGLCIGTKWSGLWFLAAFGLMTVFWDLGARRSIGARRWFTGTLIKDALPAALTMVGAALVTYLASWTGWFMTDKGWGRNWADTNPGTGVLGALPGPLRSFVNYEQQVWKFNVGLSSPHPYQSNPWSWIIMGRPTSFFYEAPKNGQQGCTVDQCSRAITDIGTLPLWWGCALAVPVLLFCWALRRDWRAGAVLCGLFAGWFPWFLFQERTIYTFYAVAFVPWVVLAVTYVLGLVVGTPQASPQRRRTGLVLSGGFVVLCASFFAFWWPVLTAEVIPNSLWQMHMWFPSWI